MANWAYTKGLHDLGNGGFAWLQPLGTWGWSNAGLITSRGESLLVDTLFGLDLTRDMLEAMRLATPAAASIGRLVNTHGNPDHTLGNQLVEGAEIIGTAATAHEISETDTDQMAFMARNWRDFGDAGAFLHATMGEVFDFSGVTPTPPTTLFERELEVQVGDKRVRMVNVGPAHTDGDTLVYVPEDRTVFTGDILFNEGHPIMWAGPVSNWIAACDHILSQDVETVVPGHGPITDKRAVENLKRYFEYIRGEARKRYDAGMSFEDAARDITFEDFRWSDQERIVANCLVLYREFGADLPAPNVPFVFAAMHRYMTHKHGHDGSAHEHGA